MHKSALFHIPFAMYLNNNQEHTMFILKKNDNTEYLEQVNLLASKIIWMKEQESINVILLVGQEKEDYNYFTEDLFHTIAQKGLKASFTFLKSNDHMNNNIDLEHDLNLVYLDNINYNPHLASISQYTDTSILVLKSSCSKRTEIHKTIELLKSFKIKISGSVLHNYQEKVPSFIRRVFY